MEMKSQGLASTDKLEQTARNVLLHQLSKSPKSSKELSEILANREIPAEIAEPVIQRFIEVGLIDDLAVAESFVNHRSRQLKAKRVIAYELKKKGVDDAIIEQATDQIEHSDQEIANMVAAKRIRSLKNLEEQVVRRRLMGFLQRRGFSGEISSRAISFAIDGLKLGDNEHS
jgi:regulatory protein